jgi:hypothetical protein
MYEDSTDIVMLFVRAADMKSDKVGTLFGAASPFFEVENDDSEVVARSDIFRNDSNPQWPPIKLDLEALCQSDPTREISLSFYDWNKDGVHKLLGIVTTNLQEIKQAAKDYQAQRSASFSDKKVSYELGESGRVFIYDVIQTAGMPTACTMNKKKSGEGSITPTEDTESETDSYAQLSYDERKAQTRMTADDASVCASVISVVSNASTVMVANGEASPRQKPKAKFDSIEESHEEPSPSKRVKKVKSLFSGAIDESHEEASSPNRVNTAKSLFSGAIEAGAIEESHEEISTLNPSKQAKSLFSGILTSFSSLMAEDASPEALAPKEEATPNETNADEAETQHQVEQEETLVAAEQRGAQKAQHEVADEGHKLVPIVETPDDYDDDMSDATDEDSVNSENVHDLMSEIDELLVNEWKGKEKATKQVKSSRVSASPIKSKIAWIMRGRKKKSASEIVASTTPSRPIRPQPKVAKAASSTGRKPLTAPVISPESPAIESPSRLSARAPSSDPSDDLLLPVVRLSGEKTAAFESYSSKKKFPYPDVLQRSDSVAKKKQYFDRPKKEYLPN